MKTNIFILFALVICCTFTNCSDDAIYDPYKNGATEAKPLNLTPIAELNQGTTSINSHVDSWQHSQLMMDYRSYIDINQEITGSQWPQYPRIRKLTDDTYIFFCHEGSSTDSNGYDTFYATSSDLENWIGRGFLFEREDGYKNALNEDAKRLFTNADGFVLNNGDLLAFASYRIHPGYTSLLCHNDNGIIMKRSTDNGKTWNEPQEIYHGPNWEATMLQLPSGELQCYFSESRPSISGGHSGTSMIVSTDNGKSWLPSLDKTPYRVVRQQYYNEYKKETFYTDQMAGVIKLNNSNKLAFVGESAVSCINNVTTFNISFAYTDESGVWPHLVNDEVGPVDRQNYLFAGSSPTIIQFPSGESVISYGLSSRLNIRIGDTEARNFGEPSVALSGIGSWGGIMLDNNHSMIAINRNSSNANDVVISLARYYLNHCITATSRTANLDGDNSEWQTTDDAIFVGAKSQAQTTLRCSADDKNIYFLIEVFDKNISTSDYVNVLLSPRTSNGKINSEARRARVSHTGQHSFSQYGGGWREIASNISVKAAYDGTPSDSSDEDNGYIVEISVPRSEINIADGEILVNLVLADTEGDEDAISSTTKRELIGWIPIIGL